MAESLAAIGGPRAHQALERSIGGLWRRRLTANFGRGKPERENYEGRYETHKLVFEWFG
jgi:hypothetical protein